MSSASWATSAMPYRSAVISSTQAATGRVFTTCNYSVWECSLEDVYAPNQTLWSMHIVRSVIICLIRLENVHIVKSRSISTDDDIKQRSR